MRTFDAKLVAESVNFLLKFEPETFDPIDWIANKSNYAMINEHGDIGLFESELPKIVSAHYYFQSRGKEALISARELLAEVWNISDIELIRGLTPLTQLGARWMTRQLGFKSYGIVHPLSGPCELFIMTRKEYNEQ